MLGRTRSVISMGLRLLDSFKGMSANDQAKQLLAEVMLTGWLRAGLPSRPASRRARRR